MSQGRAKPLLATETGQDITDLITKAKDRGLAVIDRDALTVLDAIHLELRRIRLILEVETGHEVGDLENED